MVPQLVRLPLAILVFSVFLHTPVCAETFTSEKFLNMPGSSQKNYITTSVGMMSIVVARRDKEQAGCINRWLSQHLNAEESPATSALKKFPNYHPQAVLLAVIQKACGEVK